MLRASVDLVHVLPPPCGGIPMHLKRMYDQLLRHGVECRSYLDSRWHSKTAPRPEGVCMMPRSTWKFPFTWKWLVRYGLLDPKSITHFHDGFSWSSVVYAMRRMGRPTVMTIHDTTSKARISQCSPYDRLAAKWIVRDPGLLWIAVSQEAKVELVSLGVAAERISIIPAYLPPIMDGTAALPPELEKFAGCHSPLLAAYGFRLLRDPSGRDAYGFDLCCEALAKLSKIYPSAGLVLLIPDFSPWSEGVILRQFIQELGLEQRVLLWTQPLDEAWPLWRRADVYLRPSSTDGDALAIREALETGTRVVASDVVVRPQGVFLHKTRDSADFLQAISRALECTRAPESNGDSGKYFEKILQVYRAALVDVRWNREPGKAGSFRSRTPRGRLQQDENSICH